MRKLSFVVGALLFFVASAASAQHVDVNIYQENGNLRIGGFDFGTLLFEDRQVFESELFDPDTDGQFDGDDPGWTAVSDAGVGTLPAGADNLPGNAAVTLDFVLGLGGRSISFWDGNGAVSFGATPDNEVLEVTDFLGGVSVLDGTTGATGMNLGTTTASGLLHEHIDFGLRGDLAASDAVTEGIYLLEGQVNVAGFANPSSSFFILFGTFTPANEEDMEEAIELAEAWVEANLVVPEPGTLLLLGSGLAGLAFMPRRRRS